MRTDVKPFLRWAGGKRWLACPLAPVLSTRLSGDGAMYIEPFLGSGAMFFAISPRRALLSDLNADLINAYQVVASQPRALLAQVRRMPVDEGTYYRVRRSQPRTPVTRAARFVYLNRTCYGGLYRENRLGQFNTPYGGGSRTTTPLWERGLLESASRTLAESGIGLAVCDFAETLERAQAGDVVYCDPTYSAVTRSHFDRYGSLLFSWSDQERLATAARAAAGRGALVLISNAYCPEVRELYRGAIRLTFRRHKSIGNAPADPDQHREYLMVLDPAPGPALWRGLIATWRSRRTLRG
jgi:DNA adenine methylase